MARLVEGLRAKIRHPVLKRMVALWDAKRGGREWPLRSDFDPVEFVFALGYVSLIDVHVMPGDGAGDDSRRYFFRLDGTRQVDLFGIDCTGKFLDQVFEPAGVALADQSYGAAVAQGVPQYHVRQTELHGRPLSYEIAILPLSRHGDRVDMLMTVVTPDAGAGLG